MFIPDPGSMDKKIPGSRIRIRIRINNLSILTTKLLLSSRKKDPECSSRIRITDLEGDRKFQNGDIRAKRKCGQYPILLKFCSRLLKRTINHGSKKNLLKPAGET
jgi:hypothetical protein